MRRRAAVSTLFSILRILKDSVAPILPILAAEIDEANPSIGNSFSSGSRRSSLPDNVLDKRQAKMFDNFLDSFREDVVAKLTFENLKSTDLNIAPTDTEGRMFLDRFQAEDLCELLQVPKVTVVNPTDIPSSSSIEFGKHFLVTNIESKCYLCPRCRLKTAEDDEALCKRCDNVMESLQSQK